MKIIDEKITIDDLKRMASETFRNMIKAVVDVDRELIALNAELHSDLEAALLENGSKQKNLWGINFYTEIEGEGFIEFDSLINIRPSIGNRSRGVEDEEVRKKIMTIAAKKIMR